MRIERRRACDSMRIADGKYAAIYGLSSDAHSSFGGLHYTTLIVYIDAVHDWKWMLGEVLCNSLREFNILSDKHV